VCLCMEKRRREKVSRNGETLRVVFTEIVKREILEDAENNLQVCSICNLRYVCVRLVYQNS
jgi:hypothetical protein